MLNRIASEKEAYREPMYAWMMSFFVAITLCNQCLLQNDKWWQKVVYFQCRLVVFTKQDDVCGIDPKLIITVLVFITTGGTLVFFFVFVF